LDVIDLAQEPREIAAVVIAFVGWQVPVVQGAARDAADIVLRASIGKAVREDEVEYFLGAGAKARDRIGDRRRSIGAGVHTDIHAGIG